MSRPSARRVVVAGSSGLIGGALCAHLIARGDDVVRLVRREPSGPDEVCWDPTSRHLDPAVLEGADAVVNLAGAGVGDRRWTPAYKEVLVRSRTDTTHALATAIALSDSGIRLVNGSAVGYYGDRGDEVLTEESPPGTGFLADLVRAWEGSAGPALEAGAPVAFARTGLVLAGTGGAAAPLVRLGRFGLAGPLGLGRQWWSWLTLHDEVRALIHLLDGRLTGPVNLTGPAPARQREVARAIGRALRRPALLPAPTPALRVALGEFAADVLSSQRAVSARLEADGFSYEHCDLVAAARWVLAAA